MKTGLQAGFARVNINPPLGIDINGYWVRRNASGFLDNLEANALALRNGDKTVVLIAVDNVGIAQIYYDEFRNAVSEKVGLPIEAIFLHCTHTHTGPSTMITERDYTEQEFPNYKKLSDDYKEFLLVRCVDVAKLAIVDLKPAKMGYGVGVAPNIAFVRRYRMKDGSVKTNPGVNNPDIVAPIGQVDERVSVVRFDREGAETIVLTNMGNHPDTVGGNLISGDWPTLTRHYVEKALDNTKCIFFNGTQGDVNHVNVHPTKGDFNGMFNDFDGCSRGYEHTKYMARVVTGGVLQAFDKVNYVENDELKFMQKTVQIPANKSETDDLELAEPFMVKQLTNAEVGFAGPVGLDIPVYVDKEVAMMKNFIVGANETDMHYKNVNIDKDFTATVVADIRTIEAGDICPKCGKEIKTAQGIEVGHIFKLGTKYSDALGLKFLDEDGKSKTPIMGCYGIGVTRCLAAAIEQNNDENGIIWPVSIAPYQAMVIPVNSKVEEQAQMAEKIYEELKAQGIEVLLDDRNERAGVKFKDADLIGIPVRIVVGKKCGEGVVEYKERRAESAVEKTIEDAVKDVVEYVKSNM